MKLLAQGSEGHWSEPTGKQIHVPRQATLSAFLSIRLSTHFAPVLLHVFG